MEKKEIVKRTKKIILELVAVLITLGVAFAIIVPLFGYSIGQTTYDTFAGTIKKTPLTITSPVYGQIMSLPEHEGDSVHVGQLLAIVHMLNPASIPANSPLYQVNVKSMLIKIASPVDGIIGQISFAPLSTIAGAAPLMTLYTATSMEVRILLPQGNDVHAYVAFYAFQPPNGHRYLLHILGQVPTDVLPTIDPTTSVYRTACTGCQSLIDSETIAIAAQKPQTHYPLIDTFRSWWNTIITKF